MGSNPTSRPLFLYFHQFLTCDIVVAGKRFTIDVVPLYFNNIEKLLDESLQRVKRKIKIDGAFFDGAFPNSKIIPVLLKHRIKYLMPMIKNAKVKEWMDKAEGCKARLVKNFEIKTVFTNLYLVDDKEGVKCMFVTNMNIPVLLSHYLFKWYSKRWGIETGYRLKAQDLRLRTTSKNYTLRLFYFLFCVMLYNLWVITNVVVGVKLFGRVPDKPLITTKRFLIILYKVRGEYVDSG